MHSSRNDVHFASWARERREIVTSVTHVIITPSIRSNMFSVSILSSPKSVFLTQRVHPFPFRTRKLSFAVPKILGWRRPGKIGHSRHKGYFKYPFKYSSLAQSVERMTVNHDVAGSSPAGGANEKPEAIASGFFVGSLCRSSINNLAVNIHALFLD